MGDDIWSWTIVEDILPALLGSLALTVWVTVLGSALAWMLGMVLAGMRLSRTSVLARFGVQVAHFVRGTPFLVQLFFVFYVFPYAGITLTPFVTGVVVLGIYYGAYASDTFMASIKAIPQPLLESCLALNLTTRRAWRRIIVPLAFRASLPGLMNYVILCFKETALLVAIGLPILLGQAQELGYTNFRYLEAYTLVGVIYLVLSYPAALLVRRLEATHVFE